MEEEKKKLVRELFDFYRFVSYMTGELLDKCYSSYIGGEYKLSRVTYQMNELQSAAYAIYESCAEVLNPLYEEELKQYEWNTTHAK